MLRPGPPTQPVLLLTPGHGPGVNPPGAGGSVLTLPRRPSNHNFLEPRGIAPGLTHPPGHAVSLRAPVRAQAQSGHCAPVTPGHGPGVNPPNAAMRCQSAGTTFQPQLPLNPGAWPRG